MSPEGDWVGARVNFLVCAYNTNIVKKEMLPADWRGFADAKWKGMLGIEAEDFDWFGTLVGVLGEETGASLFRDITAKNGLSQRSRSSPGATGRDTANSPPNPSLIRNASVTVQVPR